MNYLRRRFSSGDLQGELRNDDELNFTRLNFTKRGPSPSAPSSPSKTQSTQGIASIFSSAPTSTQQKPAYNKDRCKTLLVIDDIHTNWSKYFQGRKIFGDWDIRVEQAEFSEINLASYSDTGTMVDIQVTRQGTKVVRSFKPDFLLIRQHVRDAGDDWRNILIGFRYGGIPSINSLHACYNFLDKPWVFAQLIEIQNRVGRENFPLIHQAYYPNHREMNNLNIMEEMLNMTNKQTPKAPDKIAKSKLSAENGVTDDMILEFTESDIKDIFQTFSDRFKVRKRLCLLKDQNSMPKFQPPNESSVSESAERDHESTVSEFDKGGHQHTVSESDNREVSSRNTSSNQYAAFSAEEMLKRKEVRGRPSAAQKLFRTLLKDGAVSANVWKRAPPLAVITDSQKVTFFKTFEITPQLLCHKKELWTRLGESLQNRRKYIFDKKNGKRGKKCAQKEDLPLTVHVGDCVNLLSSNKEKVGEGVLIKKGIMFSEIVLKKVIKETEVINVSLIKKVVEYRTSRLQKSTNPKGTSSKLSKSNSPTSNVSVLKSISTPLLDVSSNDSVDTPTSSAEDSEFEPVPDISPTRKKVVECSPSHLQKSTNPKASTTSKLSKSKSPTSNVSLLKSISTPLLDVSSNDSVDTPTSSAEDSECEPVPDISSPKKLIGVYEWGKGEIFLGLLKTSTGGQSRDLSVINCEKPIAKIIDTNNQPKLKIFGDEAKSEKRLTLNYADVQNDPDINYCIMKVKLHVTNGKIQICNVKKFHDALNTQFERYAYDN